MQKNYLMRYLINMELGHVVYLLFCAGFAVSYTRTVEGFVNKIGVAIIAIIFCPFLMSLAINEYLEKNLE